MDDGLARSVDKVEQCVLVAARNVTVVLAARWADQDCGKTKSKSQVGCLDVEARKGGELKRGEARQGKQRARAGGVTLRVRGFEGSSNRTDRFQGRPVLKSLDPRPGAKWTPSLLMRSSPGQASAAQQQ